jgi:hypothetical protein
MKLTIKGLDGLKKKLNEIQQPKFAAELMDEKFKGLRCPEHGRSPKHQVNASKTGVTPSYCCDRLKELHQAKLGGSRPSSNRTRPTEVPGLPAEPVEDVEETEGGGDGTGV